MRNTLVLGMLLALFGLTSAVSASERPKPQERTAVQVSDEAPNVRGVRHERHESQERSKTRHDADDNDNDNDDNDDNDTEAHEKAERRR